MKQTKEENIKEYNRTPNHCKYCGKPIFADDKQPLTNIKKKIFCNSSCFSSYNNKKRINKIEYKCNLDKFTDKEIIDIYNNSDTLLEFSSQLGYKNVIDKRSKNIMNRLSNIGIDLSKFNNKTKRIRKKLYCAICGKNIYDNNQSGLCKECYRKYLNDKKIKDWLENGNTGCKTGTTIKNIIRDYLYKQQDNKCAICGMLNIWNNKEIKFILDHIDGDASNNYRENMRLICPNCDSQLDTYKSKNKNSARNYRHKYYEEYKDLAINNLEELAI